MKTCECGKEHGSDEDIANAANEINTVIRRYMADEKLSMTDAAGILATILVHLAGHQNKPAEAVESIKDLIDDIFENPEKQPLVFVEHDA